MYVPCNELLFFFCFSFFAILSITLVLDFESFFVFFAVGLDILKEGLDFAKTVVISLILSPKVVFTLFFSWVSDPCFRPCQHLWAFVFLCGEYVLLCL